MLTMLADGTSSVIREASTFFAKFVLTKLTKTVRGFPNSQARLIADMEGRVLLRYSVSLSSPMARFLLVFKVV